MTAMLIDTYAPKPHAIESHQIEIAAGAQSVYHTLWSADLGGSMIIKILMGLRMLPGFLLHPKALRLGQRKFTMQTLVDSGFAKLAEEPGQEILLGIAGRFWRPVGNVSPFSQSNFSGP